MKKIMLVALSLFLLSLTLLTVTGAAPKKDKPDYISKADQLIISNKNPVDRLKALEKAGWTVADDFQDDSVALASSCDWITNQTVLKQWDSQLGKYMYLIQANWDHASSSFSCSWHSTAGSASDYLAMGVVTETNAAVNAQALYSQIYVYDEDGDYYSSRGHISNFNGGGLTATVDDDWNYLDNIGENGQLWFYIQKPTNGSTYYVRSQWTHTWSETTTTPTVAIEYPWAVKVSWSNNTVPQSLTEADQDSAIFN